MADRLAGKVAVVTGASSGIGAEIAKALAARGCRLALCARRLERLEAVAHEIEAAPARAEVMALPLDVGQAAEVEGAAQRVVERFGRIDILVNNAGIGRMDWLEKLDPAEDIRDQVTVNLLGAIYAARAVLPGMMRQRGGHIINMGSMASFLGTPQYSIYAAGKFGLRGFSEALRREVAPWGVHVSVVYPGGVLTEFGRSSGSTSVRPRRTPRWLALTPVGVGRAVARLAARPRRSLVLPPVMLPLIWLNGLWPGLVDVLATGYLVRRQRPAGAGGAGGEPGPGGS